jgi:hypothetical protein
MSKRAEKKKVFTLLLAIFICFVFAAISSCQKADNLILADGSEGVTVLGWRVTQSGNPQIRTVDNEEPNVVIELNRAHLYHNLHSDIGFGVGYARFKASVVKGVAMEVNRREYQFDSLNSSSFFYPNAQLPNPTDFITLPDDASMAQVHLNGYALEDSELVVPSPVLVLSPSNGATHSRNLDLNVKWQIQKGGGHLIVILRTLENVGAPEKLLVKNLEADRTSAIFTAEEIGSLPPGRTHLMVGSANIKRTNRGEAILIGQSSGATIFTLN